MYYSEFPYYQNYYQFYNYLPTKYGYNAAFAHQATSSPQCQVGLGKQPQRKPKEGSGLTGVNNNQGQLMPSAGSSSNFSQNSLMDRQENKESELYKQQIVQWLKSMDIDQRFEVFMIKDKWFAQTIIKMFWKQKTGGDSAFALYSEEEKKDRNTNKIVELDQQFYCRKCIDHDSVSNAPRREAEQEVVRVLRIIDDKEMYDSLVFDKGFLENIDHLIEVFDIISDNNIFQTSHFSQWSWFNQNSFQTIASWIVSQFERMVQFKFIEDRQRYHQKLGRQQSLMNSSATSSQAAILNQNNPLKEQKEQQSDGNNVKASNILNGINNSIADSSNPEFLNGTNSQCSSLVNSQGNTYSQNSSLINQNSNQGSQGYSQFSLNSGSSQENLSHYLSLLQYWRSMNSSKKRKILNKGSEIHKILLNHSQIEGMERNDKQLEWYKKKKDQFYTKQKLPNDEEIQQNLQQFLEELKSEKFIDQLCFTSLEDTTSVITIVLKKIHEKLNEMYSEQIAQYLIQNDELEKNVKKKKNNTQNQNNQNNGKKKKKNSKKSKNNSGGNGNNLNLPPIKETTFAEEVSLMHQQQLLIEQQENQKQQEKLLQQQHQQQKEQLQQQQQLKQQQQVQLQQQQQQQQILQQQQQQQQNKQQNEKADSQTVQSRHYTQNNENGNKSEENSSSLENSKKCEVQQQVNKQNNSQQNNKKKTTTGNMPLVLKMQQQKKNEYLEVCCQQNKCEMIDLTKTIASRLITSCIQAVDTFTLSNDDLNTQDSTLIQNAYETDQSSSNNLKQSNQIIGQTITNQQTNASKKKKKAKNAVSQAQNVTASNTNNKSKPKKKQETLTENDECKYDNQNEEEGAGRNNIDGEDTEELPLQNYSDSDQDGIKKSSEIHSDNTTVDCQYGISSVITVSSNSKRKQSNSHNSNSSSRHTTKNINPFSDEDDFKNFKDEITGNSANNKKNIQQKNVVNNKQQPKQSQSVIKKDTINDNNDKNKKLRQGIHKTKQDDVVIEKETFSLTASQCNETLCNSSIERNSLVSSRSGSQMQITSAYSLNQQSSNANPAIDDSDFIQVGGRKKNNKTSQQNQPNRRNINSNNNQNAQNGRKNNNTNNNLNGSNVTNNTNNNGNNNNNKNNNRRKNRGQNEQQVQGDSRQNNHQNALRNNRNQNDSTIALNKASSTVSQLSQQDKNEDELNSQSNSTQSRFNSRQQLSVVTTQINDDNKQDKMQSSTTSGQSSTKKIISQQVQIIKKPLKTEQRPVAINTIDILTTKEEDIQENKQQSLQSNLNSPLTLQTQQQSCENKQQYEQNLNNLKQQKLQQENIQSSQQSTINTTSTSTSINNNLNNHNNSQDTQNQNPNTISNQAQQINNKHVKLTPVKKQKLQALQQKSPLSFNADKFIVREEYVQKSQLSQQLAQMQSNSITAQSQLKDNESQCSAITNSSATSINTQQNLATTTTTTNTNQKKNQISRKKSNQTANLQTYGPENYVVANSQQRKNGGTASGNFQNQWKETADLMNPPVQVHNNKTKAKIAKRLFRRKITNDIISFTEMINLESFRHQPSRYQIFYRIQHLLKKQFEKVESQVDLRIFGSCATGLSLPTSDIDLGITGFECHPRSDLIFVLTQLANTLEQFKWVKSIERIFTASIPIIKMEVDPFIDFKECTNPEELNQYFDPADISNFNMPITQENQDLKGNYLKVDITVECQMQSPNTEILNHMGFLSTDFVVRWMGYYIRLQPMTIVMKCFLHARNLNTNFKGGISSYCLLIMIIAFFRDNQNISQSEDYSNILTSFLKFYGTSFNPETTGISLVNGNPFFPCVRNNSQSKLQVVDPLTSKIMTQNTYLIDEILKEFQNFYNKLNDFGKKVEKQLDKMTYEQIERLDHMEYEEQKEELNLLFEKNTIESIIYEVDSVKTELYEKIFKQEQLEHNKNTSIFKIQEKISNETTSVAQSPPANTATQTTTPSNSKRSKNHNKYNKLNNNRTAQKEQAQ